MDFADFYKCFSKPIFRVALQDMMDNIGQIARLEAQGYTGDYSFEPFGADVQNLAADALQQRIAESLEFLATH